MRRRSWITARLAVVCALGAGLALSLAAPLLPASAADDDVTFDTPSGVISDDDGDDYLLASDPGDERTYTFSGTATWSDGTFRVEVLGAALPDGDFETVCETDELEPSGDAQSWSCAVTDSADDSIHSYSDLRATIIGDDGNDDSGPTAMLPVALLAPPGAESTDLTIDGDDESVVLSGDRPLDLHVEVYEGELTADDDLTDLDAVCDDPASDDDPDASDPAWESDDWSCELDVSEWDAGTHTYSVRYTPLNGPIYYSEMTVPSDFAHIIIDKPEPEPEPAPDPEPEPEPTDEPSEQPSDEPSETPSDEPSDEPSSTPTEKPTGEPSAEPTNEPTSEPNDEASSTPSATPTSKPAEEPTQDPTSEPTKEATPPSTGASAPPAPAPPAAPTSHPAPQHTDEVTDEAPADDASAPIPPPPPAPSATPSSTPEPSSPATTSPAPDPTDRPSAPDQRDSAESAGTGASSGTGGSGSGGSGTGGSAPSAFGHELTTVAAWASTPPAVWGGAAAIGGAFIMFVALPSELLHATLRSNYSRAFRPLIGGWARIKRALPFLRGGLPPWATALVTLACAALISAAAMATSADLAVLARLTLAMLAAFLTTNVLSLALAWMLGSRFAALPRLTLMPGFLLLSATSVLVSRLVGFQPAVLFGILMVVSFGRQLQRRQQGVLSTVFCGTFLGIGALSWVVYSILDPAATGFGPELTREFFTALATGGLGYCVVALLPMTYLEGLSIFRWSKLLWAALYLAVIVVFLVTIVRMPNSWHELSGAAMVWCAAFGAFGLVSLAVWAWFRYRRTPVDADSADSD